MLVGMLGDGVLFLAYLAISLQLLVFECRFRSGLPASLTKLLHLFQAFIMLCGISHLAMGLTTYAGYVSPPDPSNPVPPIPTFTVFIKVLAAAVSAWTALRLRPLANSLWKQVSERIHLFSELQTQHKALEAVTAAQNAVVAHLSHEARGPLQIVQASLGFARQDAEELSASLKSAKWPKAVVARAGGAGGQGGMPSSSSSSSSAVSMGAAATAAGRPASTGAVAAAAAARAAAASPGQPAAVRRVVKGIGKDVRQAEAAAEALAQLVDTVLDLSLLEAGRMRLRPRAVSLAALLEEAAEAVAPHPGVRVVTMVQRPFGLESLAKRWGATDAPLTLQESDVVLDPSKLSLCVGWALDSAAAFTTRGFIAVTVTEGEASADEVFPVPTQSCRPPSLRDWAARPSMTKAEACEAFARAARDSMKLLDSPGASTLSSEGLADCGGQRFPLTATAMHRTSGLGLDRAHKVAALMGGVVRQIQADGPEAAATLAPLRAELRRARTKAGPDGSGGVAVFEIWIPIDVIANPSWSNELERISHSASGGFATSWPEQASRMQLTQVAMDKDVAPPIASAGDRLDAACPPPAAAGPHTQGQEAEAGGSVGPARHRPLPHRDPAGSQSFRQTKPIPGSALAEVTADDDNMDAELARRAASHASSGRLADIEEDSGSIDVRGSDRSHERFKSDDTLGRSAAGGVESAGNGLPPGPRIDTLVGVPPPMGMGSAAAPGSPGKVAWSRGTAASSSMPTEAEATSSAAAGARDEGRSASGAAATPDQRGIADPARAAAHSLGAEVQTLSDGDKVESWLERHGVLPSLALDSASETRAPVQLDLVLSDVLMPGLDGERLCHRMAELGLPCAMVAATGTTTAETLERLPEAGFAAVLRKPYGPRQLKRVLEATSDMALAVAYLAISVQLASFEWRFRTGLPKALLTLMHWFQAFIMLCGISHFAMGLSSVAGQGNHHDPGNATSIPLFTMSIKVLAAAVSAWTALRLRPLANSLWKQVSERIHLFSELQTQHKALEAVTAAQNAVVAHLSHEARGPLQIVQASLGFARQDAEELSASLEAESRHCPTLGSAGGAAAAAAQVAAPAAARAAAASPGQPAAVRRVVKGIGKDVRQAEAAAEALAQLVDTVLDLSLLEAGRMRLRPRAVSLAALLEEAAEAVAPHPGVRVVTMVQRPFGLESLAKRWGATDAPRGLEESDVVLDPSKLSLCVGWALDSAAAFTTRGFIAVTVTEGEASADVLGAEVQTLSDGDKVESWLERHGVLSQPAAGEHGSADGGHEEMRLDLVLSDVLMPGLDGERLCHRMAELGLPCAMVAATGTTTAETLERLPEAGFAAVLRKPYGPRQLKRVLEAVRSGRLQSPAVVAGWFAQDRHNQA
ncbi:hypothetical protein FNF28_05945 [Cafeteria roenbergensis]|uniref:histidine kinase n=1 Tax=Cafeteria roenbergensis TaxID=33653 RepID=A0A5A8D2Q5_CAFRO|nr:hypothetical protein FNF28_05945 [Cafeteria roenbergensis]